MCFDVRQKFWLLVCRYAYKKIVIPFGYPDGIPEIRDFKAKCIAYAPRQKRMNDWCCQGDGHYLCKECAYYTKE